MVLVDANAILRLILSDNEQMVAEVKNLIRHENVLLRNEVVAEIVYVLMRVYKVEREIIRNSLIDLADVKNIHFESNEIMKLALQTFQTENCDFIDCLLYAYNRIEGFDVFTFDKKLKNLIDK